MKSVLNYFVRKAFGFKSTATAEDKTLFGHLLRIRQNIQGVYDWLYGRLSGSVDGTVLKRMPMTEAVVDPNDGHEVRIAKALNSANLLAHLRLLDGRKISNVYQDGTPADDGLPDGVSLARLLCDSTLQPTELVDDNVGWVAKDGVPATFPTAKRLLLGCKEIQYNPASYAKFMVSRADLEVLEFPELVTCEMGGLGSLYSNMPKVTRLEFPKLVYLTTCNEDFLSSTTLEEFIAPNLATIKHYNIGGFMKGKTALRKVVVGQANLDRVYPGVGDLQSCPNLIHLEIGENYGKSIYLPYWSPTLDSSNLSLFLDNFLHFIAERVAEGNFTLTLSAAVFSAIWDADGNPAVVGDGHDDLRAAINTELRYNKKWNVNKA